jgi:hypothetical protein
MTPHVPKYPTVYVVPWAAHVSGSFEPRTIDDTGLPEEASVEAVCTVCGATFQRKCSSGLMREHIKRFALVHMTCKPT